MKSIREILSEKLLQIARLDREIDLLRAAAKIVEAERKQPIIHRRSSPISQPQMIRMVLLEQGRPLHVDQIAKAIGKRFGVKLKRTDITPIVYRAIRGRKLFRKEGTNTFGLLEWSAKKDSRSKSWS
jgi:HB1, ASXL, restriction endonuclease HTH domain